MTSERSTLLTPEESFKPILERGASSRGDPMREGEVLLHDLAENA